MYTANFTDRNEPCVLVLQMTEVASTAADEVDRSDRRIRLHKVQLFLNERGFVLRNLALNDPHDSLACARVASLQ